MWLAVFASLCFKYALSQESCSVVPSYRDACNSTIDACVGRRRIELRCSVNVRGDRVQWYNTLTLNEDGTVPRVEPAEELQRGRIRAAAEGFWWCSASDENLIAQQQRCTSVPALHLYQCICSNIDLTTFRSICPSTSTSENLRCTRQPATCRSSQTLLCLSTTVLSINPATETTPLESTTENPLPPLKTETSRPTKTASIPSEQTRDGHSVTTALLLHPSVTLTADRGKDNEKRTNDPTADSSIVQLLTYIVGPVVALIATSIVLVLLTCICCLHYKKSKLRGRRQSNSRSFSVSASWKDYHIYDTVILAKPSMGSLPTFHYVSQPSHANNGVANAAEYEIPVTRHSSSEAGETNGHSKGHQQQQSSSMNPVYLEIFPGQSTGNSDSNSTNQT